ncbi:MAG: phospholipase D-like domain-containing protein [Lysobacter spongiicola]|nr:phospholipase D-like domain-containing protein [Lysobacter spongiicola]
MLEWILGGAVVLWIGVRALRSRPNDATPNCVSIDLDADTPNMVTTLAAHLNAPRVGGNRIELLVNGDRIFPPMLEAIRSARSSINLLTFIYWRGEIATTFADELAAAARRGVQVRVLLDGFGAKRIEDSCLETMRSAGCTVAWYHPLDWRHWRRLNQRTHRKILVADGCIGFTGGVGIAEEWTGDAQDGRHWRDDHFRLEGPVVGHLQGSFAENWRQATGEVLAGEEMFPRLEHAGPAEVVAINGGAGTRYTDIALTYWILFHCARDRISISTPYFAPDPNLELGLHEAARRGVEVTLLIPGPHQDSRLIRHASRTHYRRLLEAGVRIHEYQPTLLHTKSVLVDGKWALIGSSNFDNRSIRLNYETALAVVDPPLVEELARTFAADLQRADEVTLETLDGWSWRKRTCARMARLFRSQI